MPSPKHEIVHDSILTVGPEGPRAPCSPSGQESAQSVAKKNE